MERRFEGRVALVTGAASGIGLATAELLAQGGAKVVLGDVDEKRGEKAAESFRNKWLNCHFVRLDVTSETDWDKGMEQAAALGPVMVLVHAAGVSHVKALPDMGLEEWRRVMAVNTDGTFLAVRAGMRAMAKGGGSIVVVGSASGVVASPKAAAYCASKGATRMLAKAAALECAQSGSRIRVNSVHPAAVRTPIWEKSEWWADFVQKQGGELNAWRALAEGTPLKRVAEPVEVARAIAFLASDEASYITGADLMVDGGFTIQ